MAYDDQNIFAKILRGELPAIKLYEDDQVLVFMDIMPCRWSCISYSKNSCSNFT